MIKRPSPFSRSWLNRIANNFLFFARFSGYCNICGYRVDFSGPIDSEALICPACNSSSRDRMLIFCFQIALIRWGIYGSRREVIPFLYNRRIRKVQKIVVETSPRLKGDYTMHMAKRFKYIDTDFDEHSFKAARHEDLQALTFRTNSIDFILSSHVLEHVPDQKKALMEIFRVLKPGGAIFIQVPIYYFKTIKVEAEEYHANNTRVFWHVGWDLADRLKEEGFSVSIAITEDLKNFIHSNKEISLRSGRWDVSHAYREMDKLRALPLEVFCDQTRANLHGILPACCQQVFIATKR